MNPEWASFGPEGCMFDTAVIDNTVEAKGKMKAHDVCV